MSDIETAAGAAAELLAARDGAAILQSAIDPAMLALAHRWLVRLLELGQADAAEIEDATRFGAELHDDEAGPRSLATAAARVPPRTPPRR